MLVQTRWRLNGLSLAVRRFWVGAALVPAVLSVANYYAGWVGSGSGPKGFMTISFVVLWAVIVFIGPTLDEMVKYQHSRQRRDDAL